jgi:hypothetical protein
MEASVTLSTGNSEKRRHSRLTCDYDVDVIPFSGSRAGDQITGKIINISKEGLGAVLKAAVEIRTQVSLTIYSDNDQSVCSGEIIWSKEVEGRMVHGIKIMGSFLDPLIDQQPH